MKFNYIRRFKTLWRKKTGFLRPWEFQLFACRCNWGFRSALLKCVMCGATSSPSKRSSPSVYFTPDYLLLGSTTCWDCVLGFLPLLNFSFLFLHIHISWPWFGVSIYRQLSKLCIKLKRKLFSPAILFEIFIKFLLHSCLFFQHLHSQSHVKT